jgi:cytochrome c551/c552
MQSTAQYGRVHFRVGLSFIFIGILSLAGCGGGGAGGTAGTTLAGLAAPTDVIATAISSTQINLSWAPVTGATGYNVYASASAGLTALPASKRNWTPIEVVGTWTITGLTAATQYYVLVTALNASGESAGSTIVTATTNPSVASPTTPTITGFSPTTGEVGTSVIISGANLGLGVLPVSTVKFGTSDAKSVVGSNTGLTGVVPSSLAIGAYPITIDVGGIQIVVGTFTVTAMSTSVMPNLAKNSSCAACHAINRKVVGPAWLDVGKAYSSNGATTTGVNVPAILAGKTAEEYLIAKVTMGGSGNWGSMPMPPNSQRLSAAEIKTLVQFILSLGAATSLPAEPSGLGATNMNASQINLAWASVTGATGYNVYRTTTANVAINAANRINTTPVGSTSYIDTNGLIASTPYYYKVTAMNGAGESVLASNEVTATPEAVYGLTFSSAFSMGGITTFANSSPSVAGTTSRTYVYVRPPDTTRYVTVGYSAQSGIELITTQINEGGAVAVPTYAISGGCLIGSADILDCSNYGIVFDRTAGSIGFNNTLMSVTGGSTATFSMSGTLSFPPF